MTKPPLRAWRALALLAASAAHAAELPPGAPDDPTALLAAAARLEHGEGVERDLPQALALYCRAARAGEPSAQYALGWMLANGRGTARDPGAAAQLFGLAAAQGHVQAATMLQYTNASPGTPLPACLLSGIPLAILPPEERPSYLQGPSRQVAILVDRLAPEFGIDPRLAMAIISVESGFNPLALSPKQAQGLMQLIPDTALRFNVKDAFDPEQNLRGGLAYLRWLLAYFQGDVQLVAAAYNAGERAVDRHGGVPPYPETRDYVSKIMARYRSGSHPYQRTLLPASPLLAPPLQRAR